MTDETLSLVKSARPFSLVVAVVSCGLGVYLGLRETAAPLLIVVGVLVAGLLLQIGVNLINDRSDLRLLHGEAPATRTRRARIRLSYRLGLICFGIAIGIGLSLVMLRGWPLLTIGIAGVIGAFAYTLEPINYKRRGLGVMMVFWLMGVMMVEGAYLAVTGTLSWQVFWHALPVSCLVSLLLLSNEIRDIERDRGEGVATLAVRIGLVRARRLFWALVFAAFALSIVYSLIGLLSNPLWLVLPVPVLMPVMRQLYANARQSLPPWTGRLLLLFGIGYALAL